MQGGSVTQHRFHKLPLHRGWVRPGEAEAVTRLLASGKEGLLCPPVAVVQAAETDRRRGRRGDDSRGLPPLGLQGTVMGLLISARRHRRGGEEARRQACREAPCPGVAWVARALAAGRGSVRRTLRSRWPAWLGDSWKEAAQRQWP